MTSNGIKVEDRKSRVDQTYAPDAVRARLVVKELAGGNLADIAEAIAKVTGDQAVKIKLQELVHNFREALRIYAREELHPVGFSIDWMGPVSGIMSPLEAWAPEHKVDLVAAWNALLIGVNAATKVGVHRINRFKPITLQADFDDGPKLIARGIEWN
jgi:hypothetical protein